MDDLITDTLAEAAELDASDFADACVDITGVPATEVAALVRESCWDWPAFRTAFPRLMLSLWPRIWGRLLRRGQPWPGRQRLADLRTDPCRQIDNWPPAASQDAARWPNSRLCRSRPGRIRLSRKGRRSASAPAEGAQPRGHVADLPRQARRCDRPSPGRGLLPALHRCAARSDHHALPATCEPSRPDMADRVPRRRRQLAAPR